MGISRLKIIVSNVLGDSEEFIGNDMEVQGKTIAHPLRKQHTSRI